MRRTPFANLAWAFPRAAGSSCVRGCIFHSVLVVVACGGAVCTGAELGSAPPGQGQASREFAFGVEYMVPGLGAAFAKTGAQWAKAAPAGFDWGSVEPKPPVGGQHTYDWSWPDGLIGEYQRAGFRHFHIYTQVRNRWAGTQPTFGNASLAPKPEHLAGYAEYLRAMVERYDGDGQDDMPGLLYPIRYWEIEAEWGTFWPGTAEEYLELLRLAHRTVKQADPKAQVILQGFLLMGVFDGDPSPGQIEAMLNDPVRGKKLRQGLEDIRKLLAHPELFDVVEFHSLGDWTEIIGTARFLRAEMQRLGYQKPIWAGDVNLNLNPMIWWNRPFYPYVAAQKADILKWIAAMKNARDPLHAQASRWFRTEQASFTAKKIVCAVGEGLAGINMGNLEDWSVFSLVPSIMGTSGFCGLIDVQGLGPTTKQPHHAWAPRLAGQPRPAMDTMTLLIEKLSPFSGASRLQLGPGVYAYRCHTPLRPGHEPASVVVAWYDDGKGQLPGDAEPTVQVRLPTPAASARLCALVRAPGQPPSAPEPIAIEKGQTTNQGQITLRLTETPVLVEEFTGR